MPFKPFKFVGKLAKGVFKGLRDFLPIPQIADSLRELKIRKAMNQIRQANPNDNRSLQQTIAQVMDIIDDGQLNDSNDDKKTEMIARVTAGALPALAYLIYGILTGDWSFIF